MKWTEILDFTFCESGQNWFWVLPSKLFDKNKQNLTHGENKKSSHYYVFFYTVQDTLPNY